MSVRAARRRDARLLPVAVLTWAAAASAGGALSAPLIAALCAVGAAVLLTIAALVRDPVRSACAIAAVGCAFGAAAAAHVAVQEPGRDAAVEALESAPTVEATVRVVGKLERYGDRWSIDAHLVEVAGAALDAPITVTTENRPPGLDVGALVRISGGAREPFDARAVAIVDAQTLTVSVPPAGVLSAAAELRAGLRAVSSDLPQPGAGLVAGLAVGDTIDVERGLEERMRVTSLSHLTAVSGANCAIVVALAFGAAALCGAARWVRVAAGMAALAGFTLLVTPEPSVVRAAAMAAIAMLAVLLGRIGAGVSLLCAAVVLSLVLDPWLAWSLGFALSAAATAGLLLLAGPLADGIRRWLPAPLALGVSVPVAAQLACGPLLVLITPTVPLYGVVANLIAAPAAPAATVVGLAACLVAGVPLLGAGLAALAWLPAAWIAATADLFSRLPNALLPWWEGAAGVVALIVVGAAVTAFITGRMRRIGVVVLASTVAVQLAVGPVATWLDRAVVPAGWAVVMCDVGQGDAALLRSGRAVALVDTGPDPARLERCLSRFGVTRIDLLVLTHFDIDHVGGVAAVVGKADAVLHGPFGESADAAMIDDLAAAGAAPILAQPGMVGELGQARWQVVWPPASAPPGNDASVTVRVEGGGVPSILLLGDLAAGPQALLTGRVGAVDIVKVAHHGSADQDPGLYRALTPVVALIGVGDNDYGHPRSETLSMLERVGSVVGRTDRDGDIAVWFDAGSLRVWRSPPSVPGAG